MLDGETAGRPLRENDPREVGPYRIISVLGSGAMGRVYLGRSAEGPAVAVKVVRADLADITLFRKRFAREIRVVRKIDGAGIVSVLDADPDARQPWIATEYIAGPSLQSRVDEQGVLSDLEVRALVLADLLRHDLSAASLSCSSAAAPPPPRPSAAVSPAPSGRGAPPGRPSPRRSQ